MTKFDAKATWEELGHEVHPLGERVLVRTHPIPERSAGGIFLPKTSFYDGLANDRMLTATVLNVGPKVSDVKRGDVVMFSRMVFARYEQMADKTMVGWVDYKELLAVLEAESDEELKDYIRVSK